MNSRLREHVTSVAFNLSLTGRQIDCLVWIHHSAASGSLALNGIPLPISVDSLRRRGLVSSDVGLTKAGVLVAELLIETGMYQDRLTALGLDQVSA